MRWFVLIWIAASLVGLERAAPAQTRSPRELGQEFIPEGTVFPQLRLPLLESGRMTSLDSLIEGRKTVLHVFASW